jgi:hypothetical protein
MLTVRLEKYGPHSTDAPTEIKHYAVREVDAVHVSRDSEGRQVVQLGDAGGIGGGMEVTVGLNRTDCSYDIAYVMNSSGQTVDKIR